MPPMRDARGSSGPYRKAGSCRAADDTHVVRVFGHRHIGAAASVCCMTCHASRTMSCSNATAIGELCAQARPLPKWTTHLDDEVQQDCGAHDGCVQRRAPVRRHARVDEVQRTPRELPIHRVTLPAAWAAGRDLLQQPAQTQRATDA